MNHWLVTWEWLGDHAKREDKIVAILSGRRSSQYVSDFIEQLYLAISCTATEAAYFATRRRNLPYPVRHPVMINDIPHGDRMLCGYNPELYARKVNGLIIIEDEEADTETLSWAEPPVYSWNKDKSDIIVQRHSFPANHTRKARTLLNKLCE